MRISIDLGGTTLAATLEDNPSARDFAALLPLTLSFEDYASTEKIAYLPRRLRTEGSGPFAATAIGDLNYYAPWGNLAIFYRPYRYSSGLVRLGRLDGDLAALKQDRPFAAKLDLVR